MITLLTILHILVCIFLIGIVLLQHGKGADIGATFGGSNQTVFGTDGPLPLLNKITTAAAIVFMLTSLILAYNSAHKSSGSVMEDAISAPSALPQETVNPAPSEAPLSRVSEPTEAAPASNTFPGSAKEEAKAVEASSKEAVPTPETAPEGTVETKE